MTRRLRRGVPIVWLVLVLGTVDASADPPPTTLVLARPESPYRSLARDIAARESIPLVDSVADALALRPAFLLWVVAPWELSDKAATSFNVALDRASPRPSSGLITGSTERLARALYERASLVGGPRAAVILGEDAFGAGAIVEMTDGGRRRRPLAGTSDVLSLLGSANYVHYAGHGGSDYWRLGGNDRIVTSGIPPLHAVVVSTMSCQTIRIWEPGSIALRMVDAGAAAYTGFYYSPTAGYQIAEEDGPFRHTWPEVPIGLVVEAMNAGAAKGYARVPFHLLLGDPRLALRSEAPCRLVDQGESGGVRTLSCSGAPSGLIPVRVRDGAQYRFAEASGTTAWDGEPFFNRRMQMTTIGGDRLLLIDHAGGDLHVALRRQPPLARLAIDPLADALDDMLISNADRRHGGDLVAVVFAALATVVVVRRVRGWRTDRRPVVAAAVVGLIAGLLHASYALARQGDLVVISKPLVFSPLAAIGTGVLVACGAFLFLTADSWRGRLAGTIVATSVGWFGGIFMLAATTAMNVAIASRTGGGVWIYRTDVHPLILSAAGCAVCALAFRTARRFS